MAYPSSFYRDPALGGAEESAFLKRMSRREQQGCAGCKHERIVWGRRMCIEDMTPGPRGFCKRWAE
jgi:hypothetical protein